MMREGNSWINNVANGATCHFFEPPDEMKKLAINSSLSVITFILWIGGVKDVEILSLESIFFGFTAFLMVLILRKILKLSTRGLLEDFVVGVIKNKSLLYQIVFSLILLILGLYV